jgi:NIPSNAP
MKWLMTALVFSLFGLGAATFASRAADDKKDKPDPKKGDNRVFELRTYHAAPGKLKALEARFRDHTMKLFEKHGITNIGYWTELNPKQEDEKLIYIIAFPSKEAADKSWKEFGSDPEWKKVREESEKDGPLLRKESPVESVYLKPTDYSPIK